MSRTGSEVFQAAEQAQEELIGLKATAAGVEIPRVSWWSRVLPWTWSGANDINTNSADMLAYTQQRLLAMLDTAAINAQNIGSAAFALGDEEAPELETQLLQLARFLPDWRKSVARLTGDSSSLAETEAEVVKAPARAINNALNNPGSLVPDALTPWLVFLKWAPWILLGVGLVLLVVLIRAGAPQAVIRRVGGGE